MYTYMYKTRVCSTSSSTINDNILKHLTLVTYCSIFITSRDYTTSCDNTKSMLHVHVFDTIDKTQQTKHMQCINHSPSGSVNIGCKRLNTH